MSLTQFYIKAPYLGTAAAFRQAGLEHEHVINGDFVMNLSTPI